MNFYSRRRRNIFSGLNVTESSDYIALLAKRDSTLSHTVRRLSDRERRDDNERTCLEVVPLIIRFFQSAPACTLSYLTEYYNSPPFYFIT